MFSVMRPINSFLVWRPNEMNMGRTWFLEVWLYVCVFFFHLLWRSFLLSGRYGVIMGYHALNDVLGSL